MNLPIGIVAHFFPLNRDFVCGQLHHLSRNYIKARTLSIRALNNNSNYIIYIINMISLNTILS